MIPIFALRGAVTRSVVPMLMLAASCTGSATEDAGSGAEDDSERFTIPASAPSIRGIVTVTDSASIRVETDPASESGSPKAVVRLTTATRVGFRSGDGASPGDLTLGHNVSVWFDGPVRESYPVQADGAVVVIEPAGVSPLP